jgi:nucleoside phosphorylase
MHLITMAHLGEAQGVIEKFKLTRLGQNLFTGVDLAVLITGEGPFEAATKTALVIHQLAITHIINLGIAGSLNTNLEIGSIHPVRTIYLLQDLKPQFKTFPSSEKGLDCLTSFERILDPAKAAKLKGLGELVDREAWGVAMAAKTAGIPFVAYKMISDFAGTLEACELIQDKAAELSQTMAEFLSGILNVSEEASEEINIPGFYFTFSSAHKFKALLTKLSIKENLSTDELLNNLPLEKLREQKLMPKERSKRLLDEMEDRIDPTKALLQTKKKKWLKTFEDQGFKVQTDSNWENPEVSISFVVTTNSDLTKKSDSLKSLSLDPFIKIMNGDFHVE